jgi:hypothetical protein
MIAFTPIHFERVRISSDGFPQTAVIQRGGAFAST